MENEPGYTDALNQAAKGTLHGLSAKFGNPADSPNAWKQSLTDLYQGTAYPALQNYRSLNANAGGLSRFAETAPGISTGAIGAQRGVYDAIGGGIADIFNPPRWDLSGLSELTNPPRSVFGYPKRDPRTGLPVTGGGTGRWDLSGLSELTNRGAGY